jgi:L-asparaginase II
MQVLQRRGGFVETVHRVRAVAVVAPVSGPPHIAWETGAPTTSPWRSAGKPLQLLGSLLEMEAGRCDPAGSHESPQVPELASWSAESLALGASSHSGQPGHVARVRALLAGFGLDAADLRCGAESPAHAPTARELTRAGEDPSALHNDCSGKHTFMLGACVARGWDREYRPLEHPLQQAIRAHVIRLCGETPGAAVDGCGVPVWVLSVAGMARAWAHMSAEMAAPMADPVLGRIGHAMAAHPWLVSGDDRLDLALAEGATETWVGKVGAGGVFCISLPERRLGIAIKVETGNTSALAVAVEAVTRAVAPGALGPLGDFPWRVVRNVVGDRVGDRVVMAPSGA